MNKAVSLIGNDKSQIDPSVNALSILNETQNVKEWLENEFVTYFTKPNISQQDVGHKVEVLMGNKMVAKMHNRKIENTFGLIFHHAMTREPIADDNAFLYIYKVDLKN